MPGSGYVGATLLDAQGSSQESLPHGVLIAASVCASVATVLSLYSIVEQLKNYRKPLLQRWVVRILLLVPIFALASMIALFSLEAAFLIDLVRDLYEAFCIYSFFALLISYLGGERSLLVLLHGREPTPHPWPISIFCRPLDISDPFSFLFLKRGILPGRRHWTYFLVLIASISRLTEYVQVKPVLAGITIILKATDTYKDGQFEANAGYTYITIAYNFSVSLSLYCLAMFWVCTGQDLKPFRPMPKFLCVKALIFFTFWQQAAISIGVKSGLLHSDRYSSEHFSIAISDAVLCFEMPFFALLHIYAFSYRDYMPSKTRTYSGRLPFMYALRDSIFGYKDVLGDSLTTLRGSGFSYRTFEPAEGGLHSSTGDARARRAKAGLRYADGGKTKYWLPMPGADAEEAYGRHASRAAPLHSAGYTATDGSHHLRDVLEHPVEATSTGAHIAQFLANPVQTIGRAIRERRDMERGYAPIVPEQAEEVVHPDSRYLLGPDANTLAEARGLTAGVVPLAATLGVGDYGTGGSIHSGSSSVLEFGDLSDSEEQMYKESKQLEFGDYNYPVLDASKEEARREMRELEDAFIQGRSREWRITREMDRRAWRKDHLTASPQKNKNKSKGKGKDMKKLPDGCIDILVEDHEAEEEQHALERERGEPALRSQRLNRIFRRTYGATDTSARRPDFPHTNSQIPDTPAMELADPQEGVSTPVEAKAPPSFARLTDLMDGSPLKTGPPEEQTSSGDQQNETVNDRSKSDNTRSRSRHKSHEPEYNPWDA